MRVALLIGRDPSHRYSLHRGYVDAVWAVGATPIGFAPPPGDGIDRYLEAVTACDAVCVTGGGDVDPIRYGGADSGPTMDVDPLRDAAELAAVDAALAAGAAVLGICRGIQVLAVAGGGTLHTDLPTAGFTGHWEEERQHEPVHRVSVDAGTLAERALAGARVVNSIHHQAVRDPGPRLRVTARSDDGVIEAIESEQLLGVQWHPERLWTSDGRHLAPFRWLVA